GDAHLRAGEGVLERQPHTRLEVAAPFGLRPRAPPAATTEDSPELTEQVGEVDVLVGEASAAGPSGSARPVRAEHVELLAPLRVRECVVGALDLLEPLLRRSVSLVRVGMALPGQLAIRLLDLVVGGRLRHAENLVG